MAAASITATTTLKQQPKARGTSNGEFRPISSIDDFNSLRGRVVAFRISMTEGSDGHRSTYTKGLIELWSNAEKTEKCFLGFLAKDLENWKGSEGETKIACRLHPLCHEDQRYQNPFIYLQQKKTEESMPKDPKMTTDQVIQICYPDREFASIIDITNSHLKELGITMRLATPKEIELIKSLRNIEPFLPHASLRGIKNYDEINDLRTQDTGTSLSSAR